MPCLTLIDWSAGIMVILVGMIIVALKSFPSQKQADKDEDNRKPKVHYVRKTEERTTWW